VKSIAEEYKKKHPISLSLYKEAGTHFPGGVTHDARFLDPFPLFMKEGRGPRKWDVDGNEYLCYIMGHGALLLGHSHPDIVSEVQKQMSLGTHLGSNTRLEMRWARAVKALVPSIEKIRFHSSGTEATLMALRLARAFTGKNKIVKLHYHFHGWHDYLILQSGSYGAPGIPEGTAGSVVVLPAGDIDAVEDALKQDGDIAGLIIEPTGAHGGLLPVHPDFLRQLREVTERYGVLLIFDEVITGFRDSPGGSQVRYDIRPDLSTFAKIMAGGMPGGAVGGRGDVLDMIAIRGNDEWNAKKRIAHPGTYNANPLCASAGSRCLEILSSQPINRRADEAAGRLVAGFNAVLESTKVRGFAFRRASMAWVVFGADYEGSEDFCSVAHEKINEGTSKYYSAFKTAMLNAGVDVFAANNFIVSATHTEKEVEATVAAFEQAVTRMQQDGVFK
jgi:glutamate-1-semialdehyde 2,1-aminomutase